MPNNPNMCGLSTAAFVAAMEIRRYRFWRMQLDTFQATQGVRPLLSHIPETDWQGKFGANDDAFSATVEELQNVD